MIRLIACFALCASSWFTTGANAAEIRVQVIDKLLGNPLAGASVCLGTPGNPAQFGAQVTPANGFAVFDDIPQTPLLLTVSRPDYTGYQRTQSAKRFDITLYARITSGGLGPECQAGAPRRIAPIVEDNNAPTVGLFSLDNGANSTDDREVQLHTRLSGQPTHYRVAEHWSFADVEWRELDGAPVYELSAGSGHKKVYFQVRRLRGTDDAQIESLSGIAQANIYLTR